MSNEINITPRLFGMGVLALFCLFVFFGGFKIVDPGERGVVVRLGTPQPIPMDEGLNLKWPFIDSVEIWDVKVQKIEVETDASSSDLQTVHGIISVNYRVNPSNTPVIHQKVGQSYTETVIEPAIQESVKAITAKFKAEQLLEKRAEVRDKMEKTLQEKLNDVLDDSFIVVQFNIADLKFDRAFNKSIEQKQVAEQEAKKARNEVERARAEADKRIEEARGRAESLKLESVARAEATEVEAAANAKAIELEGKAIENNPRILQLRAISKWNGVTPRVTLGGEGNPLILVEDK